MIYCPKCSAPARCYDSRCNCETNSIWRRHECTWPKCRYRFTSVEIIPGEFKVFKGNNKTLVKLAQEMVEKLKI